MQIAMKVTSFLCFCLFFSLYLHGQDNPQLVSDYQKSGAISSYDKFKNQSTIATTIGFGEGQQLAFVWVSEGPHITKSDQLLLAIPGATVDTVYFLIDGTQRYTVNLTSSGAAILDNQLVGDLYKASSIEIKIGDSVITMKKGTNVYNPDDYNFKRLHYFIDYFYRCPNPTTDQ